MSKLDQLLGDDWHNEKLRLEHKQAIKDLFGELMSKSYLELEDGEGLDTYRDILRQKVNEL